MRENRHTRVKIILNCKMLKFDFDQNIMSRMEQKCVFYGLSDVAVPVLVTEMKVGPHKLKLLNLEMWCLSSPPL